MTVYNRAKKKKVTAAEAGPTVTKAAPAGIDFVSPVRELLMVRIARELDNRQLNQAQAAQSLCVSQPRISDLRRGLTSKFTIDALVQFVGLLDLKLSIDTVAEGEKQNICAWLDASEDAVPYYTRAMSFNPALAENYWKRGHAYFRTRQYDLAIGDYTRAMELDQSLQYLRINRAQAYAMLGQWSAAILDCEQLLAKKPEPEVSAWAYITMASTHQGFGQYDQALDCYDQAVAIAPDYFSGYFHRGDFLHSRGQLSGALADFSKVLEIDPDNSEAAARCASLGWEKENKQMDNNIKNPEPSGKSDLSALCTAGAQRALFLAREEASALGQSPTVQHLLLGLLVEGRGVAAKHLTHLQVSLEALRRLIAEGSSGSKSKEQSLDQILAQSYEECVPLGHKFIGSEHLLLSLLKDGKNSALFENLKVAPGPARTKLLSLLGA